MFAPAFGQGRFLRPPRGLVVAPVLFCVFSRARACKSDAGLARLHPPLIAQFALIESAAIMKALPPRFPPAYCIFVRELM